jgi:predicted component of type VI protein secretion system
MGSHMKTTIEISDVILERAKALAAREGTTVRALVEDGLRQLLRTRRAGQFRMRDASVAGNGLTPEFQDADWERIREAVYGERP